MFCIVELILHNHQHDPEKGKEEGVVGCDTAFIEELLALYETATTK